MSSILFGNRKESQDGFTLIEVMVALVVFVIAIVGCYQLQVSSSLSNTKSNNMTTASTWAQAWAEDLISRQCDHSGNTDALLLNNHGNASSVAHLDDATAATADGTRYVHADGTIDTVAANAIYTIFWNIVDDRPLEAVKQIRIIVTRTAGMGAIQIYKQDYFKLIKY